MAIQNVSVNVVSVSPGVISVEIGSWQVDLTKEMIRDYMDGSCHDPLDTVIRNLCVRLKLAGVDGNSTKAQLVAALNGITFKAVL
jgi:hypothetical protein